MVMKEPHYGALRGIKRQRDADDQEDKHRPPTRRKLKHGDEADKLSSKLHHSWKEAQKAAKAAKTFEVQRLVKRLKQARGQVSVDVDAIKSLEDQLQAVKSADPHDVGNCALYAKLKKDAVLSLNEICISALEQLPSLPARPDPATDDGKAWNRLLSSKKLAASIAAIVLSLRRVLGEPSAPADAAGTDDSANPLPQDSEGKRNDVAGKEARNKPVSFDVNDAAGDGGSDVGALSGGSDEAGGDPPDVDSTNEPEGSFAGFLDSDFDELDDGGWESGSIHSPDSLPSSGSQSDDGMESGDRPVAVQTKGTGKARSTISKPADSMFLPSLSVGFVGGASDDSDYDDADASNIDGPERKNRRGQRARKAIWEKKYGQNANHLKKQRDDMRSSPRGRGRVAVRGHETGGRGGLGVGRGGLPSSRSRGGLGNGRGGPSHSFGSQRGVSRGRAVSENHSSATTNARTQAALPPAVPKPERPVHPSWAAKQNRKETGQILPSQGKKIVFS